MSTTPPTDENAGHPDELSLAYMSIDTLKNRIVLLEQENAQLLKKLYEKRSEPHPASPGWSGDDSEEYHRGIGGGSGY